MNIAVKPFPACHFVHAFADAGCRYLQLDEVNFAYLCDAKLREQVAQRGEDPSKLPAVYAGLMNAAIADIPPDMTITTHVCRGNFRSTFVASGGYEPIAERLFNKVAADVYFLEYDTERAGGFEPLRHLPKGKFAVLGIMSTKLKELEAVDEMARKVDAAARFAPKENLCLSPQCGFASNFMGNPVTLDDEKRKLSLVVETAKEVWGTV